MHPGMWSPVQEKEVMQELIWRKIKLEISYGPIDCFNWNAKLYQQTYTSIML